MDKELHVKDVKRRLLLCLSLKPDSLEEFIGLWRDEIDTTGITTLPQLFERYEKEKGPLSQEDFKDLLKSLAYVDVLEIIFSCNCTSSPQKSCCSSYTGTASGVPSSLVNVGPSTVSQTHPVVTGRKVNNAVASTNDIWSGNAWKATRKLKKEMPEQDLEKLKKDDDLKDRLLKRVQELEQELENEKAKSIQFRSQKCYLQERLRITEESKETLEREIHYQTLSNEKWREAYHRLLREVQMVNDKAKDLERQLDNLRREANKLQAQCEQQIESNRKQDRQILEHRFNAEVRARIERLDQHYSERLQQIERVAQENCARHQQPERRSWIIQPEEVQFGREIGRGAWGIVYEGTFRGTRVAVKQLHDNIISDHNHRLFEREMDFGFRCRHKNVLQFMAATGDDRSPLIVTERADRSLTDILKERTLSLLEIARFALDTAEGLNYFHLSNPPIVHRDVKPDNVLIFGATAKVSDLGTANIIRRVMTPNQGTLIYSAPETWNNQYSTKADVYSFGLLLLQMYSREQPNPEELQEQVQLVTHDDLRRIINQCIEPNPDDRPDMERVICVLTELKATMLH